LRNIIQADVKISSTYSIRKAMGRKERILSVVAVFLDGNFVSGAATCTPSAITCKNSLASGGAGSDPISWLFPSDDEDNI